MRPTVLPLLLCATFALAACDRDAPPRADDPAAAAATTPGGDADPVGEDAISFERTWLGVLPCADCDGIQTRLQLVRDGERRTYELEETYLGADGDAVFSQQGLWVQEGEGDRATVRLDPGTPAGRVYALLPDGALDQLDSRGEPIDDSGQYRLQRL